MKRLLTLFALTASCSRESDEDTLKRLHSEQAQAYLTVLMWQQTDSSRARDDSLYQARLRLQLAERNLNLFMQGH